MDDGIHMGNDVAGRHLAGGSNPRGRRTMSLKVVGAGVGRTGTHSLKIALEQLFEGRCHHMVEILGDPSQAPGWIDAIEGRPVDWSTMPAGYVSLGRLARVLVLGRAVGRQPRSVGTAVGA